MGLKLRLGLAGLGLALSSMFGVNMLSGVKDYVDTTGNIMVDIADGIGMVSKGIEALEYYLDPGSSTTEESTKSAADLPDPPLAGAPPITPPVNPPPGHTPDQPTVFCQKGKCYPYDPAKMKNPNMNLEAKPGMILTAPAPPPPQNKNKKRRHSEDEEDEEDKPKVNLSPKNKGRH
eukprot:GFUD01037140.1.p1 GENE.GFUD01037140.1~~GFUD01037140.1.p1  ORF type:complete len:176 (+),score=59.80 GFUD01037140.1:75-602(+)